MSILAADGIVWLVTKAKWRKAGVVFACAFLLSGIVSQRIVLQRDTHEQAAGRPFERSASALRKLGVRPPCVTVSTSVAYYLGCTAPWTGEPMPAFLARTPSGLKGWRPLTLPGLDTVIYVPAN